MAEFLQAVTAVATVLGGLVALAASVLKLFEQSGTQGADGGEGPGRWFVFGTIGAVLLIVGALAFVQWWTSRPQYQLTVEIQDKQSRPDRILANEVFTGVAGRQLSDETLGKITTWVTDELREKDYELDAAPIELLIEVPADASVAPITVTPSDPRITLSYGFVRGRVEDRLTGNNTTPSLNRNYFILVERPQYDPVWIPVTLGEPLERPATLEPARLRIAVGEFICGDASPLLEEQHLAEKLESAMVDHYRVDLYPPEVYQKVAETVSDSPDTVARQEPWELDLLILGNYELVLGG